MQKDEDLAPSSVKTSLRKRQRLWALVGFVGLLLSLSVILGMSKCDRPNQEHGGKSTDTEHSQIIQPTTTPNLTQEHSLKNGLHFTSPSQGNVESTVHLMQENKSKDSIIENLEMTSELIHVLK